MDPQPTWHNTQKASWWIKAQSPSGMGTSASLACPGPARQGNFIKLQSLHHREAVSLLGEWEI